MYKRQLQRRRIAGEGQELPRRLAQEPAAMNDKLDYARKVQAETDGYICLLYTSPSPRDRTRSRMPSSAWKKKKKQSNTWPTNGKDTYYITNVARYKGSVVWQVCEHIVYI